MTRNEKRQTKDDKRETRKDYNNKIKNPVI